MYEYQLFGWVILPNHYHLLFKSKLGRVLPDVMRKVHSKSAVHIKKHIENPTRIRIWYNYWDSCIRDERSLYMHLNYIHQNPVKHGLVKNPVDYEFSSYREYLKLNGEQWLLDIFRKYPVMDFMKYDD